MSDKEVSRLEVMKRLKEKSLSQREAARILGVSVRHVVRLFKAYLEKGTAGLVSQRRGRESNNRLSEATRVQALDLLGSKYRGFGPTLACEYPVGARETSRSGRAENLKRERAENDDGRRVVESAAGAQDCHAPDARAQAMLGRTGANTTGSRGARQPVCCWCSSTMPAATFCNCPSWEARAFSATTYFERCGKPVAFYSDKNSIFRVNIPNSGDGDNLTQFGRAMRELQIEIICANTPQAKGRVERAKQILPSRPSARPADQGDAPARHLQPGSGQCLPA